MEQGETLRGAVSAAWWPQDATPSRRMRWVFALVLAAAASACLALPAIASAAATGSITGTVTQAENGGAPIEGMFVCAYSGEAEHEGCAQTNKLGVYAIANLPSASDYIVYFSGEECLVVGGGEQCVRPFISEYWDKAATFGKAAEVAVSAPSATPNIDASMYEGAQITGTVVKASGATPIEGTEVCAESRSTEVYQCAFTNASGEYAIEGLPSADDYVLEFYGNVCGSSEQAEFGGCSKPYVTQYWEDVISLKDATQLDVTAPDSIADKNAQLAEGGKIEGVVTKASIDKAPVSAMGVCASDSSTEADSCAETGENGEYAIEGLPSGAYSIEFTGDVCDELECAKRYETQYYDGKSAAAEADLVNLTAPLTVSGIDASVLEAAPKQPGATAAPVLSGSANVGSTLTCSPGSWANDPTSLAYSWLREGQLIPGQNAATYTVQEADQGHVLMCEVTASNGAGSAIATSNALSIPVPAPAPPKEVKPGLAKAAASASVKAGRIQLSLTCVGEGACQGKLKLTTKVSVKSGKHRKRKMVTVTIGEASFSIAANGYETIAVSLKGQGKSLLAKAGKHGISVLLSGAGIQSRRVILKSASKNRAKSKEH